MSDIDILIGIALATEGAQESPAGSNKGPYVERLLKKLGIPPGSPWCAAQVSDWGRCWERATGKKWPLPFTASVVELHDAAQKLGLVHDTPLVGDLFVVWEHIKQPDGTTISRFGHVGLVLALPNITISGNTTRAGQAGDPREGWLVANKPWRSAFAPEDRFLRLFAA